MRAIDRNGLSGLALKVGVIAFAGALFGCLPRAPASPRAEAAPALEGFTGPWLSAHPPQDRSLDSGRNTARAGQASSG